MDQCAREFSVKFYQKLVIGMSIINAFNKAKEEIR